LCEQLPTKQANMEDELKEFRDLIQEYTDEVNATTNAIISERYRQIHQEVAIGLFVHKPIGATDAIKQASEFVERLKAANDERI
jgi:hypothetical protein